MGLNSCTINNRKLLSFFQLVLPMVVMLDGISIGCSIFNIRAESMILIGTATALFITIAHGYTWEGILQFICNKISEALPVISIIASIGFLAGVWMVPGTIPMMIRYGLRWIDPQYFYISVFMPGALISVYTDTSWGSIGIVDTAMIGVVIGPNISLLIATGAIISGCQFGNKLSPVSDSANTATLAAGVSLYSHIGRLLQATGPGLIICYVVYSYMGMGIDASPSVPENTINLASSIGQICHFNILLLLPPIIVLYGLLSERPPIPMLFLSTIISTILMLVSQQSTASSVGESVVSGFKLAMLTGDSLPALSPDVSHLLEQGGATSMFSSFVTVFSVFNFAGTMSVTDSLHIAIDALTKGVKSTFCLVATTIVTTFTICVCTTDGTLPLLLCGNAFKKEYKKRGLAVKNPSRVTGDAGTVVELIIPWSASGVYCTTMPGIATFDYLPWATLCYGDVISALLWAATSIDIVKYESNEVTESMVEQKLQTTKQLNLNYHQSKLNISIRHA